MNRVSQAFRELMAELNKFFIFTLEGSCMEPTLSAGDTLLVSTDVSNLQIGEIILFKRDKRIFAHRIYKKDVPEKGIVQTKADGFLFPDEPVACENILGKVILARSKHFHCDKSLENQDVVQIAIDKAECQNEHRIMDAGTGPGVMSIKLALNHLNVTSLDHSEESLLIARENAEKVNVSQNIFFISGDLEEIEYQEKFDRIFAYHTFHHLQNPEIVLGKLLAGCKTGGKLILIEFNEIYLSTMHQFTMLLEEKGKALQGNHPLGEISIRVLLDRLAGFVTQLEIYQVKNDVIIVATK